MVTTGQRSSWGTAEFRRTPIIVVLRTEDPEQLPPVVDTLVEAGIVSIELTLTVPHVLDHLGALAQRVGPAAEVGVGTVLSASSAQAAIDAGANYLVTPSVVPDVLDEGRRRGVPVIGGALTPTEIIATRDAGAPAVKIFPANLVGPPYLKQLHGPFPDLAVVPSGGVDQGSGIEWIRAGAVAVSVGNPLLQSTFRDGDLAGLGQRARRFAALTRAAVEERSAQ